MLIFDWESSTGNPLKTIFPSTVFFLKYKLFPPAPKSCGGCICELLEKERELVFAAWLRTSPWSPVAWLQNKAQEVQLQEARAMSFGGQVFYPGGSGREGFFCGGIWSRIWGLKWIEDSNRL